MPSVESLLGKPYLSYSSVSTYLECGEKFRLTRIEKAPRSPAFWFHSGSAIHHACDVFDYAYAVDGLVPGDALTEAQEAFRTKFKELVDADLGEGHNLADFRAGGRRTAANPNGEDYDFWLREGPQHVANYAAWRVANPQYDIAQWDVDAATTHGIEVPFTATIGGTKVHGYIDRVFTWGNEHVIVDLKSGKRIPAGVIQLGTYLVGLEQEHGIAARYGGYLMTKTGELSGPVDISRYTDLLPRLFEPVREGVERELFVPHVTSMCGSCEVKDFCYMENSQLSEPWTNPNMTLDTEEVGA